eukprot:COSAG06_NODE_20637_length_787_cov_0.928779_1_plen_112_part_00
MSPTRRHEKVLIKVKAAHETGEPLVQTFRFDTGDTSHFGEEVQVGVAKGARQILWETGWYQNGMVWSKSAKQLQAEAERARRQLETPTFTKEGTGQYVLAHRADFKAETSD